MKKKVLVQCSGGHLKKAVSKKNPVLLVSQQKFLQRKYYDLRNVKNYPNNKNIKKKLRSLLKTRERFKSNRLKFLMPQNFKTIST